MAYLQQFSDLQHLRVETKTQMRKVINWWISLTISKWTLTNVKQQSKINYNTTCTARTKKYFQPQCVSQSDLENLICFCQEQSTLSAFNTSNQDQKRKQLSKVLLKLISAFLLFQVISLVKARIPCSDGEILQRSSVGLLTLPFFSFRWFHR